ncbi:MAG: DUF4363 family protein [Firmicutes bacterium]|nr:DUF4363 family protein [Bacillota bacterium]
MKRLWIGILVLAVTLAAGLGLWRCADRFCGGISRTLEDSAAMAQQARWDEANALTDQARAQWEQYRDFFAAFTDHEPVEEVGSLFRQLEIYAACRDACGYATTCVQLSSLADAIREAHGMQWWTVL